MLNRLFGQRASTAGFDTRPPDLTFGFHVKGGMMTPLSVKSTGNGGQNLESQVRSRKELRADPTGLALAYASNPTAHRCVDLRARKVAEMPRRLVRKSDGSVVEEHALWSAVERARHYWGNDLFYLWQFAKCIHGECYFEKVPDQFGRPFTLRWLNPVATEPLIINGKIDIFYYSSMNGGIFEQYRPDEIIYDHYANPLDDFRGLSPMQIALPSINTLVGIGDYQNSYFQNDATPGGILSADGNTFIGKTDQDRLMGFWRDQLQGAKKRFRAIFMPANVKWQSTQQNPSPEHELVETGASDKVCTAFGVPTSLVSPGNRRYSLAGDEDMKIFYENTIIPECIEEEKIVNQFILPWFDPSGELRYEHDFAQIRSLLEDQVKQATAVNARQLTGNISLNEARAKFGDMPVEGGDLYFMPKAVMPLSQKDLPDAAKLAQEATQTPQQQGVAQENQTPVDKSDQQADAMRELKLWRKLTFQKGLDRGRRFDAFAIPAQVANDLRGMLYGISDLKSADEREREIQEAFGDAEAMLGQVSDTTVLSTMMRRLQEA